MNIGDRIKKRRLELGMTADELGELINKSRATIYRYENGDVENMPTPILEPLAKALQTTPAELMGWEPVHIHKFSLDSFYSSNEGHKLISSYLSLNEQGRQNLLDHCDLLLSSDKYYLGPAVEFGQLTLLPSEYTVPYEEKNVLNAAHERTDIEVTDEMRKHDDDIMDDENF